MPNPTFSTANAHVLAKARKILRNEFTDFFVIMTSPSATWPAITDDQLTDAIAEALITMGERRRQGDTLLRALVDKLNARIPRTLN
jgi:hypothetical protein